MNRHNFDDFRTFVRWTILGATVARLVQDKIARGEGAATDSDMRDYSDEGNAVADLWCSLAADAGGEGE